MSDTHHAGEHDAPRIVLSNPPAAAMAMVPNRMGTARETSPMYPLGMYFLNACTNADTIRPTSPDASVVAVEISIGFSLRMMKVASGMVSKATVVWSVAEPLAGVNKVGVGEVVQLGDALPAVGSEDAAEGFSTLDDMHTTTCGQGSAGSS